METSPDRSFPLIGDCIGCESCVEAMPSNGGATVSADRYQNTRIATKARRRAARNTEYPPPIALLARTGNCKSRTPWVMRRHYTSDGRLVLREERVRHHEYLRTHRSGDRVTLQLVQSEDNDFDLPGIDGDENNGSNGYLNCKEDTYHEEEDGDNKEYQLLPEREAAVSESGGGMGGCGEWQCLYKTVRPRSSCMYGIAVGPSSGVKLCLVEEF